MSSLFVGNLSSHVRHRELENAFRRFGRCSLELKEGFGFVSYEDHRNAKRALEALQGRSVCGEQPSISWARKRRPFQRFSGKGNLVGRDRYYSRKRPSMETEKGSDDGRREEKFVVDVKDGSRASEMRDESARSTEREVEWKYSAPERIIFDDETKDADILDTGRWDPHMEGSPDNILVEGLLADEQHPLDDKDKEDERGSIHEKSQGYPRDRHRERSSRIHRNSSDQNKRGRDAFGGRQQERCYNCGQSGHVKWQCRSRPRRINVHTREGCYDGRRNDLRYPGNRGGFRGIGGGGRFRGSNGARRMLARDVEPGYGRRSSRRHEVISERKHLDPEDITTHAKSRRRRHRSESPNDSSSRGRSKSKRKHKKSSKKTGRSRKKRRRSSSGSSPSTSQSPKSTSSSPSRSDSHSESRSRSSKSGSESSESGSGSASHSQSSESRSSGSRSSSASSSSRSRSVSSRSRKSVSRSRSQSPLSRSPESHGISSPSPKSKRMYSPRSSSTGGSRSPLGNGKEMVTPHRLDLQDKDVYEMPVNHDKEEKDEAKCLSEFHNVDPHDSKRSERRRVWSREAKKQKIANTCDDEEPQHEAEPQSNGVNHTFKGVKADGGQLLGQQVGTVNVDFPKDILSFKGSEAISQGQVSDAEHNVYFGIMEDGEGKGASGGQDRDNPQFGAARLWPWKAMLFRRLKRGPISTDNYERRKAQNEEFSIKDTFVRSSSGWWENPVEE